MQGCNPRDIVIELSSSIASDSLSSPKKQDSVDGLDALISSLSASKAAPDIHHHHVSKIHHHNPSSQSQPTSSSAAFQLFSPATSQAHQPISDSKDDLFNNWQDVSQVSSSQVNQQPIVVHQSPIIHHNSSQPAVVQVNSRFAHRKGFGSQDLNEND